LVQIGPDGTYAAVAVRQEAPAEHPTLRSHRIAIGLYDLDGPDRLVRRRRIELTVEGERTDVPELVGVPAADVLLLNDDDLTYAKLRLDERSLRTVVEQCGIAGFDSSLPRALVWAAVWDMLRDAELPARDYVRLVLNGLPAERDINLVTTTQRQAAGALTYYADPAWAPTGWAALAATARAAADAAEPGGQALAGSHSDKLHGSGFQLAWARQYVGAAQAESELAELRGWLSETAGAEGGTPVPAGLAIDTELRWGIVQALMAHGAAGEQLIEAELERDRTATGEKEAALARALIATPEAKAAVWRLLTSAQTLPNWQHRALLQGFQHPRQVQLTAPYAEKFFEVVADIWARRDNEPAQEFVILAYPNYQVSEATVAMTDAWLAEEGHPAPLRRLIAEGRDGVLRALRARATDIAAGRD
jgi:aminopeptidase N